MFIKCVPLGCFDFDGDLIGCDSCFFFIKIVDNHIFDSLIVGFAELCLLAELVLPSVFVC